MVANNMGAMTPDQIGTFLKGYIKRSMEVMDLGVMKAGVLGNAFPSQTLSIPKIEIRTTQGNPGRMDVALDAPVEDTKWGYEHFTKDLKWDKFAFSVTDAATDAIMVDDMSSTGISQAMAYFANLEDYRKITELKAKNHASNTHSTSTTGGVWSSAAADLEADVITGIEGIVQRTGISPANTQFGLIYPSKVLRGTEQLDLIHNVQQTVKTYLKSVFPINFYPYTPYMDADGNQYIDVKEQTSSDALGTSALLFVEGAQTMKCGSYKPSGIPMSETTRIHDVGYKTTLRHSFGCLVVPRYDSTTYTSPFIYEVTNAST